MHTTSVGPEVSLYSSASVKLQCSWTSMKNARRPWSTKHKDSLRVRVSDLSGALSVSPTLHLSAIVWLRLKVTLLPRSIPDECTGSCCPQCRAKMRRRMLEQISSGFGMTAASMTAKPTLFPIASTFGVTRTRPVWSSLQHASIIWYEVRRWPTTTVRTWCCSLVPLVPLTGFGQ